jgi:hypothetical protein
MSRLTVGSIEGLTENSNVISVPTGHTLNAVDGLQIGGVGVGEYIDYSGSITFTNFTLGNGTVDYAQYARVGDLVHYWGQVTLGSTSSITGLLFISAPVSAYGVQRGPGKANYTESGVGAYTGVARPSGSNIVMYAIYIVASYGRESNVQATIPFTWGAGDTFHWNVVYRGS